MRESASRPVPAIGRAYRLSVSAAQGAPGLLPTAIVAPKASHVSVPEWDETVTFHAGACRRPPRLHCGRCRKCSRSRTTSPPSSPASATACSDALRERLDCTIRLRGNQLTLEGDDERVAEARAVVDELVELVEGGHEIGPGTVDAVLGALDQAEDIRDVFDDVVWRHRGTKIAPKTVNQKRYVDAIRDHTITFGIGPAGTGKTYLAMALAVAALTERQVGRIILTRPAVEAGERLGFLPGDLLAKVDPYLRPLYDALYDMLDADRLTAYMEKGAIEVAPLAFMRGRTLNDSFIILDEAQNTSPEQMQMFLTRLGFGSKIVVTGDVTQIDLPPNQASGLISVRRHPRRHRRDRLRRVLARGRRPAQARPADRRGVPHPRRGDRDAADPLTDDRDRGREPQRPRGRRRRRRRARPCAYSPPRGSTPASSGSRSSAPTRAAR